MESILEAAVDSLESARAAIAGGADRLELCSALAVGGLTPFAELLQQIRAESDIPVRCLIRPRGGDFLYTRAEILMMAAQINRLREMGAEGFVIGCLNAEGDLDATAMEPLLVAAKGAGLTLHRCIDVSRDPCRTYLDARALGFDTVLTSGAAGNCLAGMETIGKLLQLRDANQGPEVLIGAGVNAGVIAAFRAVLPQARAFHMSGKTEIESGMRFRREGVPMGLPGLDEWHIQQTSADNIRAARAVLDA
ncbi:MAG: copper homeostasis protein CutC [Clostridiales bacterium]|nr:copper homeostasis protein CutC [Clostridiales bacterium]